MLSRALLVPALAAVTALLAAPVAGISASTAAASPRAPSDAPLEVTIDTLTPSVVPEEGPLEITGTVTNTSEDQWRLVKVYALTSATPITSSTDLETAADTDPDIQIGERITRPGNFDILDTLDPGQSATYSLRVRRANLGIGTAPGVYWLGVHALGTTDAGRDTLADGKARTFLPLVTADDTIETALVVPVRRGVRHTAQGAVADPPSWAADLAPGGRLAALTDFGAAAGPRPLTWLVDPAVPDAVTALAAGNPPRSLEPTVPPDDGESPSGSGSPEPSGSASAAARPAPGADVPEGSVAERSAGRMGVGWLARTRQVMLGDEVLALPYGDLDVAGAADSDPELVGVARRRSGPEIDVLRLPAAPVVASPSGYLDDAALDLLPDRVTVLVTDEMLEVGGPTVAQVRGRRVLAATSRAIAGGPGPDDRFSPVAVRQRLLSEAALRLLGGERRIVASFPADWNPGMSPTAAAEFFTGLDVDWMHLTTLRGVAAGARDPVDYERTTYPPRQTRRELPAANFRAARGLMTAGGTLDSLLPANDTVGAQVSDEALTGVSYEVRDAPTTGVLTAERSTAVIDSLLHGVTVEAPPSVTLSSDTGNFSATVTNHLEQQVLVRVQAETDPQLEITPSDPVELGPDERATVLLQASSSLLGVHQVDLVVADEQGTPLGGQDTFPLRAAEVSDVIWVVFAVGAVLLFGAIGLRLFRRVRGYLRERRAAS